MPNRLKFSSPSPEPKSPDYFPRLGKNVTVKNCYYYIAFLECFWTYFDEMTPIEQQLYLARAEWRYEIYLYHYDDLCVKAPPLDIAFLWHIHMLSPFHYYEDLALRFRIPNIFNRPFPLSQLRRVGDNPFPLPPEKWNEIFGDDEPFYLTKQNMYQGSYKRKCYKCQKIIELPWSTYVGYRFGRNTTLFPHEGCGHKNQINFLDVTRMKLEADLFKSEPTVAGTLLTSDGTVKLYPNKILPHVKRMKNITPKNELDYAYEKQLEELLNQLGKKYEYDANELLYAIRTCYQGNPSPFSIDLIHGVARQRRFYDNILNINWNGYKVFAYGIRYYHDFLVLMRKYPHLKAVPTLEIDVAFHTHMLHSNDYRSCMLKCMNRVINHDDNVPESKVKSYCLEWHNAWAKLPFSYYMVIDAKQRNSMEKRLVPTCDLFKAYYHPGNITIPIINKSPMKTCKLLNKRLIFRYKNSNLAVIASCHNYGVDRRFYECGNQTSMKKLQRFVSEGMQHHCYGYTGCVSFVSGGKSALIHKYDKQDNCPTTYNEKEDKKMIYNPLEIKTLFKMKTENVIVRSAFSNKNGYNSIKLFEHQDPALPIYTFDDLPTYNEVNELLEYETHFFIKYSSRTFHYIILN